MFQKKNRNDEPKQKDHAAPSKQDADGELDFIRAELRRESAAFDEALGKLVDREMTPAELSRLAEKLRSR